MEELESKRKELSTKYEEESKQLRSLQIRGGSQEEIAEKMALLNELGAQVKEIEELIANDGQPIDKTDEEVIEEFEEIDEDRGVEETSLGSKTEEPKKRSLEDFEAERAKIDKNLSGQEIGYGIKAVKLFEDVKSLNAFASNMNETLKQTQLGKTQETEMEI